MTYALIIVEAPKHGWPDSMHRAIRKPPVGEGFERLNESAWLIDLDSRLLFLAGVIQICHTENLVHHVAFFDQKPSFVSAPQDPV